jgi:hypothetical protein
VLRHQVELSLLSAVASVQSGGKPLRVFDAFDPRRSAILLIGGDKTGDKRFYDRMTPVKKPAGQGILEVGPVEIVLMRTLGFPDLFDFGICEFERAAVSVPNLKHAGILANHWHVGVARSVPALLPFSEPI